MTYAIWQPVTIVNRPDGNTSSDRLTSVHSFVRPDGNVLEMWALDDGTAYVTRFRVVDPTGRVIQAERQSSVHVAPLGPKGVVALDDGGFAYLQSGTRYDEETGSAVVHGDLVRVDANGTVVDTVAFLDIPTSVSEDDARVDVFASIVSNGDGTYFGAASMWVTSWSGGYFFRAGGLARIDADWSASPVAVTQQPVTMYERPGGGFYSVRTIRYSDIAFATVATYIEIFDATGQMTGRAFVDQEYWGGDPAYGYLLKDSTALTDGSIAYSAISEGYEWNAATGLYDYYYRLYLFRIGADGSELAKVQVDAMPDGIVALHDGLLGAWDQNGTTLSFQIYDGALNPVGDMETMDLGVVLRELSVVLLDDGRLQFVGFDGNSWTGRAVQFIIDPRPEEITGTAAADRIYGSKAHGSTVLGLAGNDILTGYGFADHLDGSADDDVLVGGGGGDTLIGGAGIDAVVYAGSPGGVTIDLATGSAAGGDAEGDVLDGIENLTGSEQIDHLTGSRVGNVMRGRGGDDVIVGGLGNDTLDGGAGDDTLDGGSGGDTLIGGTGADHMTGGIGNDVYWVDDVGDVVTEMSGEGTDTVRTAISMLLLPDGVEWAHLVEGAPAAIALGGSAGGDRLYGNSADNVLDGAGGDDLISAEAGDDLVLANVAGTSVLIGGAGIDTVSYEHATLGVTVDLARTTQQQTGIGRLERLSGFENVVGTLRGDVLRGNSLANRLDGAAGDDELWGGSGGDVLAGGAGRDILIGGAGDDDLLGGAGFDTASYVDATAGVTVDLGNTGRQATGGSGSDRLELIENLVGSRFADVLTGNAGTNRLEGGAGLDTVTGGRGTDTFVLRPFSIDRDVVTDFEVGRDRLEISAGLFGAGLTAGALDPALFLADDTGQATTAEQRLIYETDLGRLYFDADGSGAGARVLIAGFTGRPVLTAAMFDVVA